MKRIKKTVAIIACCTLLSINAKQVSKKIITNEQPQPAPISYYPQPQTSPTYSEILRLLEQKTPISQDIIMLHNIKREVEQQIKQVQAFLKKKSATKSNKPTKIVTQVKNDKLEKYLSEQIDENKDDLISALKSMDINMIEGLAGHIALACINESKVENIKRDDFINIFLDLMISKQMISNNMSQQNKENIRNSITQAWDQQAEWFAQH